MTDRNWDAEMAGALDGDDPDPNHEEQFHNEGDPHLASNPTLPPEPIIAVVIGSGKWTNPVIVQAELAIWAQGHEDRAIIVATGPAQIGAEEHARQYAATRGWGIMTLRDDQLVEQIAHKVFAFVVEGGSVEALAEEIATQRPVSLLLQRNLAPKNRWAER